MLCFLLAGDWSNVKTFERTEAGAQRPLISLYQNANIQRLTGENMRSVCGQFLPLVKRVPRELISCHGAEQVCAGWFSNYNEPLEVRWREKAG